MPRPCKSPGICSPKFVRSSHIDRRMRGSSRVSRFVTRRGPLTKTRACGLPGDFDGHTTARVGLGWRAHSLAEHR